MKRFIPLLMLFLLVLCGSARADGPFFAYVQVYDQDGNPLPGISVRLEVDVFVGSGPPLPKMISNSSQDDPIPGTSQLESGSDTGTTDSNGYAFLSVSLEGSLVRMNAYMTSYDYTVLSSQNTSTTTASTIFPRFDIMLDTNHNTIFDPWELPLAEKFCPSLKLHSPTDWLAPEPVEFIGADATAGLWFSVENILGEKVGDYRVTNEGQFTPPVSNWHPWINNPNAAWETLTFDTFDYTGQPPGKAHAQYWLRFHFGFSGNPDPTGWSALYEVERNNNNFGNTIYAHFFKYGSTYVIQYWFFYPYNDGTNNHEGDWEHINVHIDSQDPFVASIIQIDFYFHEKVQTRLVGDFQTHGSTHPIVFVGGTGGPGQTTGGSYPASGIWTNIGPFGYDEIVSGNGPQISFTDFIDGILDDRRGIVILPEINDISYSSNLHLRWFKAAIPWGLLESDNPFEWLQAFPRIGDVGNDGPPGPAYNSGWNTIGDNNSFENYSNLPL